MKLGFGLGLTTSRAAAQLPPIAGTVETYGDSVLAIGINGPGFYTDVGVVGGIAATGSRVTALTNYAVGGDASGQLATQITGAGATGNNFAVIHVGSNDAADGTTTETFMTNLRGACSTLKGDGKRVAVCVPIQRNDTQNGWTSTMQDRLAGYWAAMIAEPAGTWDYLVRTDQVPEWSSDGIVPNADVSVGTDSDRAVHPNPKGSFYVGKKITDTLASAMTDPEPTTKLAVSLAGTAGSKDGGCTGDVADAWYAIGAVLSGGAIAFSKPTATEQKMTFSGTLGGAANEYALILSATSQVSALSGERLRVRIDVKTDALLNGLNGFGVGLYGVSDNLDKCYSMYLASFTDVFAEIAGDVWPEYTTIYSPWYDVPENQSLYVSLTPGFLAGVTLAGSLTYRNVVVEKA